FLFFFFFQAEDGIRDRNVTGVQTCALPISGVRSPPRQYSQVARAAGRAGGNRSAEDHGGLVSRPALGFRVRREPGRCEARLRDEIGRASCRERVWSWGEGGAVKRRREVRVE